MTTQLTTTTGTVTGVEEVKQFMKMCYSKFDAVWIVDNAKGTTDFCQYTLLTKNEIRLYLSWSKAEIKLPPQ